MAITRLASQDASGTSSLASSVSAVYAVTPTLNNLLIAIVGDNDGVSHATAITNWTKAGYITVGTSNDLAIFYKVSDGAESTTVSATTTALSNANIVIYEFSGLAASSPLDQFATNSVSSGTSLTTTCPSGTALAPELVITAGFNGDTLNLISWADPMTLVSTITNSNFKLWTATNVVTSTGLALSTITLSGAVTGLTGIIATFKGLSPNLPGNQRAHVSVGNGMSRNDLAS